MGPQPRTQQIATRWRRSIRSATANSATVALLSDQHSLRRPLELQFGRCSDPSIYHGFTHVKLTQILSRVRCSQLTTHSHWGKTVQLLPNISQGTWRDYRHYSLRPSVVTIFRHCRFDYTIFTGKNTLCCTAEERSPYRPSSDTMFFLNSLFEQQNYNQALCTP